MDISSRKNKEFGELFRDSLLIGSNTDWSVILWNYILDLKEIEYGVEERESVWRHFVDFCSNEWKNGLNPSSAIANWVDHTDKNKIYHDMTKASRIKIIPENSRMTTFRHMLKIWDVQTQKDVDAAFKLY